MNNKKIKTKLKKQWIKVNCLPIVLISIITIGLFVMAVAFHKFSFVFMGILLGFISLFVGRNKMMTYVEKHM